MLPSAVPAWLLGLGVYFVVGLRTGGRAAASETMTLILDTLAKNFRFNILLLLPLVVVFYAAIAKKPTIPAMLLSSAVAAVLALLFQKASLTVVAQAVNSGYVPATGVEVVDKLLSRGGMMSMMETQLVAFTAFAFGGIMQATGMLQILLDRVMKFADRVWSLVLTTVGAAILSALVTGSSYLSMIIPGDLLAPVYRKKGLAAKNLSRIIEESGGIIVPLIPWSMAGVYITGTLGVPTFAYLGWAIMNYVSVAILILFGFTGPDDGQAQARGRNPAGQLSALGETDVAPARVPPIYDFSSLSGFTSSLSASARAFRNLSSAAVWRCLWSSTVASNLLPISSSRLISLATRSSREPLVFFTFSDRMTSRRVPSTQSVAPQQGHGTWKIRDSSPFLSAMDLI